jgi:hypothetical protein
VVENTKKGGATLTALIGTSAWLAPGAGTCLMVEAIVRDQGRILPCSVELQGEFGVKGAFVGVPVKLTSAKGAESACTSSSCRPAEKDAFAKSGRRQRRADGHRQGLPFVGDVPVPSAVAEPPHSPHRALLARGARTRRERAGGLKNPTPIDANARRGGRTGTAQQGRPHPTRTRGAPGRPEAAAAERPEAAHRTGPRPAKKIAAAIRSGGLVPCDLHDESWPRDVPRGRWQRG